jgi:uncharacterized repeat protein (TIGR03803 family)
MTKSGPLLRSILRSLQRTVVAATVLCVLLVLAVSPAQTQTYTVLHAFTGGGDGGSPQSASLTLGGTGTLYGTTVGGGVAGVGVVFKITHETGGWVLTPLLAFPGSTTGTYPQAPVVFGPGGLLYGSTINGGNLVEGSCFFRGCGVVFTLHPPAGSCQSVLCNWIGNPIYQFASLTDGLQPTGNLAFDRAGNVYGTTALGGTGQCVNGCGTVFELMRSGSGWTKTTLYNFAGGGAVTPASGVIIDRFGALYGTTVAGGLFNKGMVFQLTPSGSGWTFTVIYNFHNGINGNNDGGGPEGGLLMDAIGNLYGTTGTGGTGGGGTVFELSPSGGGWTFSLLASFSGFHGSTGNLAFDSAGKLYGTTQDDGAFRFGNVFELTPSGGQWIYTDLYDFTGGNDGGEPNAGVTLDSSGNIFGTALYGPRDGCLIQGNPGCGVVWEITP